MTAAKPWRKVKLLAGIVALYGWGGDSTRERLTSPSPVRAGDEGLAARRVGETMTACRMRWFDEGEGGA